MSQLKMYWRPVQTEYPQDTADFTIVPFVKNKENILRWAEICRCGIIKTGPEDSKEEFRRRMTGNRNYKPDDTIFVMFEGRPAATCTVIVDKKKKLGDYHMVAALPECRGRGVGRLLNSWAQARFFERGCELAFLTTDEFRVPAVRSYLSSGWLPVIYEDGMKERWDKWLTDNGYDPAGVVYLDDDGNKIEH